MTDGPRFTWDELPSGARAYAVDHLTPRQLAVFRARLDGHSWRRIALAHELDEATCRGHWKRALRNMRPFYEQKEAA